VPSPHPRSSTFRPALIPNVGTSASPLSRMLAAMRVIASECSERCCRSQYEFCDASFSAVGNRAKSQFSLQNRANGGESVSQSQRRVRFRLCRLERHGQCLLPRSLPFYFCEPIPCAI
jgi:hypothetical protein